ncbi:MAG: hypothetical protein HDQ90_08060 [Desulfovibrio sp.]|nr:hypothetical protein [Desulfovibrio sp.]
MPGIYKIGMTHKRPEFRAEELNTTGFPYHLLSNIVYMLKIICKLKVLSIRD